jgi:hypothetical protein
MTRRPQILAGERQQSAGDATPLVVGMDEQTEDRAVAHVGDGEALHRAILFQTRKVPLPKIQRETSAAFWTLAGDRRFSRTAFRTTVMRAWSSSVAFRIMAFLGAPHATPRISSKVSTSASIAAM